METLEGTSLQLHQTKHEPEGGAAPKLKRNKLFDNDNHATVDDYHEHASGNGLVQSMFKMLDEGG